MIKAIMYHYVRPRDAKFTHLKYLEIENFERQLDYFEREFGFVSKSDFQDFISGKKSDCHGVMLTFDDGLKDHYRHVFPILKRRGLWGIFYISTAPLRSKTMLDVHKVHVLIGMFGGSKVLEKLLEITSKEMILDSFVNTFSEKVYALQENDSATEYVKKTLNYFIADEYRPSVLNQLMNKFFLESEQESLSSQCYMDIQEIHELISHGMIIGNHTDSHCVMSKLDKSQQEEEIKKSFEILDNLFGEQEFKTFCYPYGGKHSFNEITEKLLEKYGVMFSFSVDPKCIDQSELKLQDLPRFDCNQFPYGRSN